MSIYSQQQDSLMFHLRTICQMGSLFETDTYSHIDQEMVKMLLEQAARFSEEHLQPLAVSGDRDGCELINGMVKLPAGTKAAYQAWCELGFPLLSIPLEHDGMQVPYSLQCAVQDLMDGANLAFGMMAINLRCASAALLKHASAPLLGEWLPALLSGEAASTIVISEPQAGSDAGRITTKAEPKEDGSWVISGTKIWISYADHDASDNILHLVLARVPGDEIGTRGLGLFAIPKLIDKKSNGVSVTRLEEKMGLHASPTCVVEFLNASGTLIGEPTQGVRNLFSMMNAMRLAVGVQGAAVACNATAQAINYALERPQGGRPDQKPVMIAEHADVKRMLLQMSASSELLRALALKIASYLDLDAISETPGQSQYKKIAELMLPVSKTLGAELGFETASQGIQVLGGYGYTTDYPLERMARDIRVSSIYEGTSGIQALDFVKRKILSDNAVTLNILLDALSEDLSSASPNNPLVAGTEACLDSFRQVISKLTTLADTNPQKVDAGCYPALRLAGLLFMACNGVILYEAATTDTAWETRLRAALDYFAANIEAESVLWATRAIAPFPDFNFSQSQQSSLQ